MAFITMIRPIDSLRFSWRRHPSGDEGHLTGPTFAHPMSSRWLTMLCLLSAALLLVLVASHGPTANAQDFNVPVENGDGTAATLIRLEFPISNADETKVLNQLEAIAARANGNQRPIVVLEFAQSELKAEVANDNRQLGRGTRFERALALARWLSGPQGSRIRSVAFLPESTYGHALLVALGCDEIAINPTSDFAAAGIDETVLDATVRQAYLDIAARRGSPIPPAAWLSLLDKNESLYKLSLANGSTEYVNASQLEAKRATDAWNETQLVPLDQFGSFTGQELRNWRWVAHAASSREQLAKTLRLTKPLTEKSSFAGTRVAIRVHMRGIVSTRLVNRVIRAIDEGIADPNVNLILLELDSSGGNPPESLRLAQYLADIPAERAEVVTFINRNAFGDAAMIALASDTIVMHPDSRLGGPGESTITLADCIRQKTPLLELSKSTGRFVGDYLGCICQTIVIHEYDSFDGRMQRNHEKFLVDEAKPPQWEQGKEVSFAGGLNFARAMELGLTTQSTMDIESIGKTYGIDELPPEVRTNRTEQFVEWLAGQAWLSTLLFMVGIIALSAELSTPGIGVAGILSGCCFLLFFWIHIFQGTIEWLEILLIGAGVACLAAELFILPGFGIFGVTGLVLLAVGLILAGQTFVIPTNEYQWRRVSDGLGQMGFAFLMLVGTAIVFRKQLANLPMVRWFALEPPKVDTALMDKENAEESLRGLVGLIGTTITRCNPSGKATIDDRIWNVVSRGDWIDEDTSIVVIEIVEQTIVVAPATTA